MTPEPKTVLGMTKTFKPTYFGAVPTIYVGLLNLPGFKDTDFSYIKGCLSGAAPLSMSAGAAQACGERLARPSPTQ